MRPCSYRILSKPRPTCSHHMLRQDGSKRYEHTHTHIYIYTCIQLEFTLLPAHWDMVSSLLHTEMIYLFANTRSLKKPVENLSCPKSARCCVGRMVLYGKYRSVFLTVVGGGVICVTLGTGNSLLASSTWAIQMYPGGRLNKKDGLTRYGDSHVKDKTS